MSLKRHIKDVHFRNQNTYVICPQCCKQYASQNSLYSHLNRVHGVKKDMLQDMQLQMVQQPQQNSSGSGSGSATGQPQAASADNNGSSSSSSAAGTAAVQPQAASASAEDIVDNSACDNGSLSILLVCTVVFLIQIH